MGDVGQEEDFDVSLSNAVVFKTENINLINLLFFFSFPYFLSSGVIPLYF